MRGRRVTVRLDPVQAAWLDAIADVNNCTGAAVLREALSWLAAKESVRVERNARLEQLEKIAASAREQAKLTPADYRRAAIRGSRYYAR